MSGFGWALVTLGAVVLLVGKVALDLANKEIQGWLADLPFVVLRSARKRLPIELRAPLYDAELLENELLTIMFHTCERKPITALAKGFRFAYGCRSGLKRAARVAGVFPAPAPLRARVLFLWDSLRGRRCQIELSDDTGVVRTVWATRRQMTSLDGWAQLPTIYGRRFCIFGEPKHGEPSSYIVFIERPDSISDTRTPPTVH